LPGGHTKNLFLKPAKGAGPYLLATLEEDRQVSVNALARLADAGKVTMASAEELVAVLGVPPGSVTPFGLVNAVPGAVRFVMDRHLAEGFDRIWVHPLTNAASTGLAPADLLRFLAACGHPAMLVDLA
jgi:Ala-tRNA(Pro) deacylase